MIVFTHIAKTSGTSFAAAIRDNFSNRFEFEEMESYANRIGKPMTSLFEEEHRFDFVPDFVHSHIPYGFHEMFDEPDPKYIAMLRDPVERCISSIRHSIKIRKTQGLVGDSVFADLFKDSSSDKQFLSSLRENEINCNIMTKQISGVCYANSIMADGMKLQAQYYMPYSHDKTSYSKEQMDDILLVAKQNIDSYAFVGFQDDFNSSVHKFCKKFGFKANIPKRHHKATPAKLFDATLNDVEKELLSMNEYDIKLYNYAVGKFR